MLHITGDTHGTIDRLTCIFKTLKPNDKILQLGDLGLIWTQQNTQKLDLLQNEFGDKELLWIDGNHQNFAKLYSDYQIVQKYGGPTHKIRNNIYHLMRGNIYTIQQKTFFTFGGGTSIDKCHRTPHVSWWPEQMPNSFQYETGLNSLQKVNYSVDYILTHAAPFSLYKNLQKVIQYFHTQPDSLVKYLDRIQELCTFRKWFIGHYHIDNFVVSKKYYFMYEGQYIIS